MPTGYKTSLTPSQLTCTSTTVLTTTHRFQSTSPSDQRSLSGFDRSVANQIMLSSPSKVFGRTYIRNTDWFRVRVSGEVIVVMDGIGLKGKLLHSVR